MNRLHVAAVALSLVFLVCVLAAAVLSQSPNGVQP